MVNKTESTALLLEQGIYPGRAHLLQADQKICISHSFQKDTERGLGGDERLTVIGM